MKYWLITGKTPAIEHRDAIPEHTVTDPQGREQVISALPEVQAVPSTDIRFEIGESNPFDASGKPFKLAVHDDLGVKTKEHWVSLLTIYGTKLTHEFINTPEGLKQNPTAEVTPAYIILSLMNEGYSKEPLDIDKLTGKAGRILFWKQKGRIEDDNGKTYSASEMISIITG